MQTNELTCRGCNTTCPFHWNAQQTHGISEDNNLLLPCGLNLHKNSIGGIGSVPPRSLRSQGALSTSKCLLNDRINLLGRLPELIMTADKAAALSNSFEDTLYSSQEAVSPDFLQKELLDVVWIEMVAHFGHV